MSVQSLSGLCRIMNLHKIDDWFMIVTRWQHKKSAYGGVSFLFLFFFLVVGTTSNASVDTLPAGLCEVSCCPLFVGPSSSSNLFRMHFAGSRSSPTTDFRACLRGFFGYEDISFSPDWVSLSQCFRAFRSASPCRSFFSLAFSLANVFSALLAAFAALRSFFNLLRSFRSSFVSALSSDFLFFLFFVSPMMPSWSPT